MTSKSNPSKTGRACALRPLDPSRIPCTDTHNPLAGRRKSTRVNTRIQAEVITEAGESLKGTIVVLSGSGLQLSGSRQLLDSLQTGFLQFIKSKARILQLCFSLPGSIDPFEPVRVQCKIVYARKAKHNTSRIDMKYLAFNEGEEILADYLLFREAID